MPFDERRLPSTVLSKNLPFRPILDTDRPITLASNIRPQVGNQLPGRHIVRRAVLLDGLDADFGETLATGSADELLARGDDQTVFPSVLQAVERVKEAAGDVLEDHRPVVMAPRQVTITRVGRAAAPDGRPDSPR